MLKWITPDHDIIRTSAKICGNYRRLGSDTSLANIFLLAGKYDIKTAVEDDVLFRYYNGKKLNRRGYGFPLSGGDADIAELFALIRQDAKERGVQLRFCLCDERQKAALDSVCRIEWECTDDDSDYIYKRESLAMLSGKKLHRKRNHINSFNKMYENIEYKALDGANAADALFIAEKWLEERPGVPEPDELYEFSAIRTALDNIDVLGLFGGVLYADGIPAAMTIASPVSGLAADVHYEKAYGEYAGNGAFTVINQCFAGSEAAAPFEYLNREEDMGIEGLRTAKESYYPAFRLKKYYGVCKC